jgi:hypothetical protein
MMGPKFKWAVEPPIPYKIIRERLNFRVIAGDEE